MKKFFKILGYILLTLIVLLVAAGIAAYIFAQKFSKDFESHLDTMQTTYTCTDYLQNYVQTASPSPEKDEELKNLKSMKDAREYVMENAGSESLFQQIIMGLQFSIPETSSHPAEDLTRLLYQTRFYCQKHPEAFIARYMDFTQLSAAKFVEELKALPVIPDTIAPNLAKQPMQQIVPQMREEMKKSTHP